MGQSPRHAFAARDAARRESARWRDHLLLFEVSAERNLARDSRRSRKCRQKVFRQSGAARSPAQECSGMVVRTVDGVIDETGPESFCLEFAVGAPGCAG